MKRLLLTACFLLSLLSLAVSQEQSAQKEDPDFTAFEIGDLTAELEKSGRGWLPFFKGQKLLTGLYMLPAGAEDRQKPHDTDEIYYVVEGRAKFKAGEEDATAVKPGTILFVKAEVSHRFFDIEEDLKVVVIFDTKE